MIYFFKTKIAEAKADFEKTIHTQLTPKFTIDTNQGDYTIVRDRVIGNRGILRVFFPRMISKIFVKDNIVYCKTKLDGLAFFMLLMSIGAVVVEFTMDRALYPREYPALLPAGIFAWYMANVVIETIRIKNTLTKILQ